MEAYLSANPSTIFPSSHETDWGQQEDREARKQLLAASGEGARLTALHSSIRLAVEQGFVPSLGGRPISLSPISSGRSSKGSAEIESSEEVRGFDQMPASGINLYTTFSASGNPSEHGVAASSSIFSPLAPTATDGTHGYHPHAYNPYAYSPSRGTVKQEEPLLSANTGIYASSLAQKRLTSSGSSALLVNDGSVPGSIANQRTFPYAIASSPDDVYGYAPPTQSKARSSNTVMAAPSMTMPQVRYPQQQPSNLSSHSSDLTASVPHVSGASNCLCRAFGQDVCTCGASMVSSTRTLTRNESSVGSASSFSQDQSQGHRLSHPSAPMETPPSSMQSLSSTGVRLQPFHSSHSEPDGHTRSSSNASPFVQAPYLDNSFVNQPQAAYSPSTTVQNGQVVSMNGAAQPYSASLASGPRHFSTSTGSWPQSAPLQYSTTSTFTWGTPISADARSGQETLPSPYQASFTPSLHTSSSSGTTSGMETYESGSGFPIFHRGAIGNEGAVRTQTHTLVNEPDLLSDPAAHKFSTEEGRWDAILRRSHSADSHFVYGAMTTRIYCRPSCASKRPDRGRVQFFSFPDAAAKAEMAGFRACKRCKPGTQGTADVCVLAVGECLRHMTRAALLGESDEVDKRLRKRTLKQYSNDYGVSAFHFHRTLKNVCTLTPGEYSKATHALVLQDEIGIDRFGRPLEPHELNAKLSGWSTRRARRALGNILPHTYASGLPDVQVHYIVANQTAFGRVVVLFCQGSQYSSSTVSSSGLLASGAAHGNEHSIRSPSSLSAAGTSGGDDNGSPAIVGVLIGEDAVQRATTRFRRALRCDERAAWLIALVGKLEAQGTREVQMPREVIPWVRRARIYLAAKSAMEIPVTRSDHRAAHDMPGKYDRRNPLLGAMDDDGFEEEDEDDEF